jgi:hypothetical protein
MRNQIAALDPAADGPDADRTVLGDLPEREESFGVHPAIARSYGSCRHLARPSPWFW